MKSRLWIRLRSPRKVTELLADWSHGNDAALAELTPLIYEELRRLAHRCLRTREILVFDSTGKLEHSIAFSEGRPETVSARW